MMIEEELCGRILGAAIAVHAELGPGLLESTYEECLAYELNSTGIGFVRQASLPVCYKNVFLECGYRLDFIIESKVILELKAVERVLPIHESQLLTYLRLSGKQVGYILNFNSYSLRDGITRRVLTPRSPRSPR